MSLELKFENKVDHIAIDEMKRIEVIYNEYFTNTYREYIGQS